MSNSSQIKWATAFIAVMLCVAFSIGQTPPAQPASGNADGPSKAQTDLVVVADFEEICANRKLELSAIDRRTKIRFF